MAACMILTASFSSLTEPMCQPPRARIDTRTPVLPSRRVGRPLPSSAPAAAPVRPAAAAPARVACRNSRRLLFGSLMVILPRQGFARLLEVVIGSRAPEYPQGICPAGSAERTDRHPPPTPGPHAG